MVLAKKPTLLAREGPRADLATQEGRMATREAAGSHRQFTHPTKPGVVTVAGSPAQDLPGCVATGRTLDETLRRMRSAIAFNIEGLRLEGQRIPRPRRSLASIVRQRGAGQLYTMLSVAP